MNAASDTRSVVNCPSKQHFTIHLVAFHHWHAFLPAGPDLAASRRSAKRANCPNKGQAVQFVFFQVPIQGIDECH